MLVYPVPALRGKDYGKTKMRYPDYMETQSGLQYKVIIGKWLQVQAFVSLLRKAKFWL